MSTPKPVVVKPSDPGIRYAGFFDSRDPDAPRFAWSGTHIEARFTGTSLLARLSTAMVDPDFPETDRVAVMIDDQPAKVWKLAPGEHTYPLATGLSPGAHRVSIWKRTECGIGVMTFHGFVLDDGARLLAKPEAPERRILVIGDSITAGYGNESNGPVCRSVAQLQNSYLAYGAVAARALDAEYVSQAWSGKGIARNSDGSTTDTMPQLIDRVIPSEPGSPKVPLQPTDVVVLNLATNDFILGDPGEAAIVAAFDSTLDVLRKRHPKALIVVVLGPMLFDESKEGGLQARTLMRARLTALRARRHAAGDTNIELIEVWTDPAEGIGCDFHPNAKTHARIGAELAAFVKQRLGW